MLKELERTDQLMTELDKLRQQVAELQEIEQRCQQAETALKTLEERNQFLGESAPLGIFTVDTMNRIYQLLCRGYPSLSVQGPHVGDLRNNTN